jgi:regulator of sigma E protease
MFITILIFIAILGILVLAHEFGHFIVARKSGMKVEEFGFGFPPRIVGIQVYKDKEIKNINRTESIEISKTEIESSGKGIVIEEIKDVIKEEDEVKFKKWHFVWGRKEPVNKEKTVYSVNLIPLGGFVKILGENNEYESDPRSFINRPFWPRLLTLVAGVLMNVILAWALISAGFGVGLPTAVSSLDDLPKGANYKNPKVVILEVMPGLPADKAGIQAGDEILFIDGVNTQSLEQVQNYILQNKGKQFDFKVKRVNQDFDIKVNSLKDPGPDQGPNGIALAYIGKLQYPWYSAIYEGAKTTYFQIETIAKGIYRLFATKAGLSSLGGPVKIARLTGQVADMGFIYLIQFTAFLSLNLAILNILPFPALDGGRILFLIIEKIRRKRNNQKLEQITNTVGFALLLLLMLAVTIKDIRG